MTKQELLDELLDIKGDIDWYGLQKVQELMLRQNAVLLELVEKLEAENKRLRDGMKGDYDLDAWLEWTHEAKFLRDSNIVSEEENKRLREALEDICKYWEYDENGDDQDMLLEIAVDKAKIILESED